jgi:hypothetical protein
MHMSDGEDEDEEGEEEEQEGDGAEHDGEGDGSSSGGASDGPYLNPVARRQSRLLAVADARLAHGAQQPSLQIAEQQGCVNVLYPAEGAHRWATRNVHFQVAMITCSTMQSAGLCLAVERAAERSIPFVPLRPWTAWR